jgi:hypothetical protein
MLSVPLHGEEALTWCGPAAGQMIMEGYPAGACSLLQEDVATSIASHKVEAIWDTDPAGLRGALLSLCPPSGTWSVYHRVDPNELMHRVGYWMTRNSYPVAILQDTVTHNGVAAHAEHWLAVSGMVTDVDPTTSTSVVLEYILLNDPVPASGNLGDPPLVRFLTGTLWFGEFQPVTKVGSAYHGEYVAVIEPPQVTGVMTAPQRVLLGKPIGAEKAKKLAAQYVEQLGLAKMASFKDLAGAVSREPMLVNRRHGGYYLIPFGGEGDAVSLGLIVNAYDGSFEEVGAFAPVRYITAQEAKARAIEYLNKMNPQPEPPIPRKQGQAGLGPQPEPPDLSAELIYAEGEQVASRYMPLWRVGSGRNAIVVRQGGEIMSRVPRIEPAFPVSSAKPAAMAGFGERLLILDPQKAVIHEVDAGSGAPQRTISAEVPETAVMAFDGSRIWVADRERMQIDRIDAETGQVTGSIPLAVPEDKGFGALTGMTWDGQFLWTAISAGFSSSLNRVDPESGNILQSVFAECDPRGIASDGETMWALCYNGPHHPYKIDRRPILEQGHEMLQGRRFLQDTELAEPRGLAYDGRFLRVLDAEKRLIIRYPADLAEE